MDEAKRDTLRVFKFGGSSVGSPERLQRVLELVVQERQRSPVAVVVSAMGDTTDWLIEAMDLAAQGALAEAEIIVDRMGDLAMSNTLMVLSAFEQQGLGSLSLRPELSARAKSEEPSETNSSSVPSIQSLVREMLAPLRQLLLGVSLVREKTAQTQDVVMSFGERLSATLVAELLKARGFPAVFVDARRWVRTDAHFGAARVDWPVTQKRLDALRPEWGEAIPVCSGFLGETEDGRTTTLGRNGSDYTATLFARGLRAAEVVICTDVSGVMTADPHIVNDAYPVEHLSYLEALELAHYGARMFHPRTMLPLIESGIPMRIRNTMRAEEPGTVITASKIHAVQDGKHPTCVTSLENLALIDVRWRQLAQGARMGQRVLRALDDAKIPVWMATQAAHGQAVAVVVPMAQLSRAEHAIRDELAIEIDRHEVEAFEMTSPVTLLSLVAEHVNAAENVSGHFFNTLGMVGVNVLAIGQGGSSRSISCVIPAEDTQLAVRTVHAGFNFAHQEVSLCVLGVGVVGTQLIEQLKAQRDALLTHHDLNLRVVGLANSRQIVFNPLGVDLDEAKDALQNGEPLGQAMQNDAEGLNDLFEHMRRLPVPILVDCTAAEGMERVYHRAFEKGLHVVAANKKPLTVQRDGHLGLMRSARRHHRTYLYETTVGASLPVVDTLKNLVRTGDIVLRIEGSFSGTLGYLTNEVMAGVQLSDAVKKAKALGYTEPRPQDDLSGLDVARKALILARELGLSLELDDIRVEPLIEASLLQHDDVGTFFEALEAYDTQFSAQIETMRKAGQTLRYLAIIDPGLHPSADGHPAINVQVGPVGIPASHPATHLRGSESFVAFTTERYQDYPLIVQGAGAGGAVTAAGVLADILRISQSLRGR